MSSTRARRGIEPAYAGLIGQPGVDRAVASREALFARAKMLPDRGDAADRAAAEELLQTAVTGFRQSGATTRERVVQQLLDGA